MIKKIEYFLDDQLIPFRLIIYLDSGEKIVIDQIEMRNLYKKLKRIFDYDEKRIDLHHQRFMLNKIDKDTFETNLKELLDEFKLKRYGEI